MSLYPNTAQGLNGLGAKTHQLDVRSSASVEVEAIRKHWSEQVNDALELAHVAERVDHRSYARQGVEMEPAVKMGHASAAIERRPYAEQIAAGEEPHAVTPRGQMNETIEEKRGLEAYIKRGQERLQEMGQLVRDQGRAGGAWHGEPDDAGGVADQCRRRVDALPEPDQSPRQQQTPALDHGQDKRDRQQQRQRGHDRDGPDIGVGR